MSIDRHRQHGVTLIELIMFMVIMGVAAAGIIGVLNLSSKQSADPARRKQALMIAEAMMEEVRLARFTLCEPGDAKALEAKVRADCGTPVVVGVKNGITRPYANVADYATVLNTAQRSFAIGGVDRDVSGRALGQDAAGTTMGNSTLAGITTTVELNVLDGNNGNLALNGIGSTAVDLAVLRITIRTVYGTGANDFIQLDGYRTRYAPNYLP